MDRHIIKSRIYGRSTYVIAERQTNKQTNKETKTIGNGN
jgi:hypothetical protein